MVHVLNISVRLLTMLLMLLLFLCPACLRMFRSPNHILPHETQPLFKDTDMDKQGEKLMKTLGVAVAVGEFSQPNVGGLTNLRLLAC